ncbi:MAG: hypothetical protein GF403_00105 [Candidatus Coatesbacteria bacterium]|nr:hypothetical protein [Candidatus Coatesbacteria bacterium]
MTPACAFDASNLHRVRLRCYADTAGEWRDEHLMGILAEELYERRQ